MSDAALPTDVLLDTHAFLWFALGDERMSPTAREIVVGASVVYVSAASTWEIRTKHRLGRLAEANGLVTGLPGHIRRLGFTPLPIEIEDGDLAGALAGALDGAHRDPFDRMLAAQAILRDLPLVSNDSALDAFGVRRSW